MTDSIKLAEIHRTNVEYERQRHLANWLIKSSPHMAKPLPVPSTIPPQNAAATPSKSLKKSSLKKSTSTQNPLFFLGKVSHVSDANLTIAHPPIFNSHATLPVQNQLQSLPLGHKPKVPRFIAQQYSNMFSVDDFENARLARRNELELKQMSRYKKGSLSSGGDCSTGDSKGSKFSTESNSETLPADLFLERFSLPRVVRLMATEFSDETLKSSISNGSSNASASSSPHSVTSKKQVIESNVAANGELYLLYRYLRNRKLYHGVNAKNGSTNRKKGVIIPQEFPGYFSTINDKGLPTASQYTTITKLVREKVYKFLSIDNLTAYTESQTTDTFPARSHYVKGTARGGQVFRLLAVFEDGRQESSSNQQLGSTSFKNGNNSGRYAQLLNENRQIIYVSLASKGKFYEIENTNQSNAMPKSSDGMGGKLKQDFSECVHRISNIVSDDLAEVPITLRFIGGPQTSSGSTAIPETITITKVTIENSIIACPIDETESRTPLHLKKLPVASDMRFMKCFLGFENELKMFSNQNVQNILKFCQFNCDPFAKMVEVEHIQLVKGVGGNGSGKSKTEGGLKILRPLNFPKLLRREKSLIAHEKEDSIIFLSKNDLENMESKEHAAEPSAGLFNEKMNVFQSTKKKWFRSTKAKDSAAAGRDVDQATKRMSLDRYQDMSKLLQERFGGNAGLDGDDEARASSEIGVDPRRATIDSSDLRQKSLSMQEFDSHSAQSVQPDLVNIDFILHARHSGPPDAAFSQLTEMDECEDEEENEIEKNVMSFVNQKSFITEKLCSEFHVKTKNHSKSSSNLQQLLHFSVPQKMNVNETRKPNAVDDDPLEQPIKTIDFSMLGSSTSFDDDLPYSSVRDSLVFQPAAGANDDHDIPSDTHNVNASCAENIYAEICAEHFTNGHQVAGTPINGGRDTIRISISSSTNSFDAAPTSTLRQISTDSSSNSDNIYNTLK